MNAKKEKKVAKKAYEKPMLRVVNIVGGVQTLGLGCKTPLGGGTLPVRVPCWATNCNMRGS